VVMAQADADELFGFLEMRGERTSTYAATRLRSRCLIPFSTARIEALLPWHSLSGARPPG
jgi:hypothetical protein